MSPISKPASKKIVQTPNPKISVKAHAAFAKVTETQLALSLFTAKNLKIISDYHQHQRDYEDAVAEAQQAYLAEMDVLGPSYAGFTVETRRSLNLPRLLEVFPDAGMVVRTEYKMTIPEFETAIKDGVIPERIYDEVIEVTKSVKAPKSGR